MGDDGARRGDWIQLISGEPFWPLDARPEEVHLGDIAWALGMQCRYAGHVKRRYSVAEHSVMVSRFVPPEHALWGLLHDATEAYLVDLPRPVKRNMPDYREFEDALSRVIAERFDLPWPMPAEVRRIDAGMLLVERTQLLAEPRLPWSLPQGDVSIVLSPEMREQDLPCWAPTEAYHEFVGRFAELTTDA